MITQVPYEHGDILLLLDPIPWVPAQLQRSIKALKYSEDQPREPAGSPDGGQFAGGGGGAPFTEAGGTQVTASRLREIAQMQFEHTHDRETPEAKKQVALAMAQTDPLAHAVIVMGMDHAVDHSQHRYIAAYGKTFQAGPRPEGVEMGEMGKCYYNATMLVMNDPTLHYSEGFASPSNLQGMAFLHAWAVTDAGQVIDTTWPDQAGATYFGVEYDRAAYLRAVYKSRTPGVIGGRAGAAQRAAETGAPRLRRKQAA